MESERSSISLLQQHPIQVEERDLKIKIKNYAALLSLLTPWKIDIYLLKGIKENCNENERKIY